MAGGRSSFLPFHGSTNHSSSIIRWFIVALTTAGKFFFWLLSLKVSWRFVLNVSCFIQHALTMFLLFQTSIIGCWFHSRLLGLVDCWILALLVGSFGWDKQKVLVSRTTASFIQSRSPPYYVLPTFLQVRFTKQYICILSITFISLIPIISRFLFGLFIVTSFRCFVGCWFLRFAFPGWLLLWFSFLFLGLIV